MARGGYHARMPPVHSLMTVHAHPDDETIATGGVMARYSRAGHRVICVTCTGGEHGEIVVPEMDTPENHARLRELRDEELRRALEQLGPIESRRLGVRRLGDDGHAPERGCRAASGPPTSTRPRVGWCASCARRRPQVIVGYNAFGGYGHPDHIRSAQVAVLAFERAGDPAWYPEQLDRGPGAVAAAQALRDGVRPLAGAWRWPRCSRSGASRAG